MNIVFRLDANNDIGLGHLMRCLVLADFLRSKGWHCLFACYQPSSQAMQLLTRYEVMNLTAMNDTQWCDYPAHWFAIDHYQLDSPDVSAPVLMFEDWPHRPLKADLVLDQNLGVKSESYRFWLAPHTRVLTGADYFLARPEFSCPATIRTLPDNPTILINLGGATAPHTIAQLLHQILPTARQQGWKLLALTSDPVAVQQQVGCTDVDIRGFQNDMARLYDEVDFCIGAAGSSCWERAMRGLPSALLVLADNQRAVAATAYQYGLAVAAERANRELDLAAIKHLLCDPSAYRAMSDAALQHFDGRGAKRLWCVMQRMSVRYHCSLRPANKEDVRQIYRWQCEPGARTFSYHNCRPTWRQHLSWFWRQHGKRGQRMWIICLAGREVGMLRVDARAQGEQVVSILLAQAYRGLGLAEAALRLLSEQHCGPLVAYIQPGNRASKRTFRRAGYLAAGRGRYRYRGARDANDPH